MAFSKIGKWLSTLAVYQTHMSPIQRPTKIVLPYRNHSFSDQSYGNMLWVRLCPRYNKGTILGFPKNYVHISMLAIPETICQFPNRRPGPTSFKTLWFRLNSFALLNGCRSFFLRLTKVHYIHF